MAYTMQADNVQRHAHIHAKRPCCAAPTVQPAPACYARRAVHGMHSIHSMHSSGSTHLGQRAGQVVVVQAARRAQGGLISLLGVAGLQADWGQHFRKLRQPWHLKASRHPCSHGGVPSTPSLPPCPPQHPTSLLPCPPHHPSPSSLDVLQLGPVVHFAPLLGQRAVKTASG